MVTPESVDEVNLPIDYAEHPVTVLSDRLKDRHFTQISLLNQPSIASVITGFILTQTGVISPDAAIVVRSHTELSDELKKTSIPLYSETLSNPALLRDLINTTDLPPHARGRLRWLASHCEAYRRSPNEWWNARGGFRDNQSANRSLHDLLSLTLFVNREDPQNAYIEGFRDLERFLARSRTDKDILAPMPLEVPFLKNPGKEPDRIESSTFMFDRRRILLLAQQNFSLVVGGHPDSGKSTFSVSLYHALTRIIEDCVDDGLIGKGDITVGHCDLDIFSPTSSIMLEGGDINTRNKRKVSDDLIKEAIDRFKDCMSSNNLVIGDLPGKVPDEVTEELARDANFSARIDRTFSRTEEWHQFMVGANLPTYLIGAHTRFGEPDRVSGVREYRSRSRGESREFLRGRVVDLDRTAPVPNDIFVQVAAHALLFDFLPQEVLWRLEHGHELLSSIGIQRQRAPRDIARTNSKIDRLIDNIGSLSTDDYNKFLNQMREVFGIDI